MEIQNRFIIFFNQYQQDNQQWKGSITAANAVISTFSGSDKPEVPEPHNNISDIIELACIEVYSSVRLPLIELCLPVIQDRVLSKVGESNPTNQLEARKLIVKNSRKFFSTNNSAEIYKIKNFPLAANNKKALAVKCLRKFGVTCASFTKKQIQRIEMIASAIWIQREQVRTKTIQSILLAEAPPESNDELWDQMFPSQ